MFFSYVLITFAVWFAYFRWRRRRMYELADKIGGEKTMPFIGHLHKYFGDTEVIMNALKNSSYESMKNGGISTLWLGHVCLFVMTDPVDLEYVLRNCLEKDDLHRFFREIIGNGVVFAPVSVWRVRRKVIVPAFSPKIVENFVEVFSEQSQILIKQMGQNTNKGLFDVWPYFSSYTLDSVSETVMGSKIKAQTNVDQPFLKAMNELLRYTCERIFHVWLGFDLVFKIANIFTDYDNFKTDVIGFVDQVVEAKREQIKKERQENTEADQEYALDSYQRKTFLDLLIENSSKSASYTNQELREEVLTLTVAGTDTSAVAMSFLLLMLGKHPEVQERVYQELMDIYGSSDRPLVKEDLGKMVYLDRVVKETLRLYPPVPFIIRKIEKEITLPSGKILPVGTGVPVSIFGVHRNKAYWGEDAELFDPDRFSPERFVIKHPCMYIPFSQGVRNCLGYQYAINSIKTAISTLLRKYKVTLPDEIIKADIRCKIDVMMKGVNGYEVQIQERKQSLSSS